MTDQPAEAWFERRVSPAAVLALLILAGVSSWLGWYAYRGELGRILSATPAIEVDLKPNNPALDSDSSTAPAVTPSVVVDLTPPPAASSAATNPAVTPPLTAVAPAAAPAASAPAISEPPPAAATAGASGSPVVSAPVLLPAPTAPGSQPVASATAPADNANSNDVNTVTTALAPAAATPPGTGNGNASSIPNVQALTSPPATGGTVTGNPPASTAGAPDTSAAASAPQPNAPQAATLPASTPLASTPLASTPLASTPLASTPLATPPAVPTPTTPVATPATTSTAPATTPAAPAVAVPPGDSAPSEPSAADLLSAIGKAPAPVTQKMIIAAASPPAGTALGSDASGGGTAASGSAGGTQQASVIDNYLQQPGSAAPAWQRYARPFDVNDPRPRIAIVITKLGLLHGTTLAAIDQLPADVTLSFSPYASDLGQWIAHARSLGHEVMLDLPMESNQSGADPGPDGLLTTLSAEENLQRLNWVIGRAEGYVGLAGVLGDRFTASPVGLRPVLRDIARRGLMFLDPHLTADSVASSEATKLRLPRAIADLTIDNTPDRVSIDTQLAELERRARITGFAIGLANGYPVTIERLADWARSLAERNLALAPVSAIADQQADR